MLMYIVTTMSLLDLILPTPAKTQEQMNEIIAKNILDVMSSSKFGSNASITQTAIIRATGGAKISGATIVQAASVNTTAFLNDKTSAELKSDLKESLKNTIANESSSIPFGREANVSTKISNIVDKSIEQRFSYQSLVTLNNAVTQVAEVSASAGGQVVDARIEQQGNIVAAFTNSVARDITGQLYGATAADTGTTTKTDNWLAETVGSMSAFFGGLFGGIISAPVAMLIVFIAIVLLLVFIVRAGRSAMSGKTPAGGTQPDPMPTKPTAQADTRPPIDVANLPPVSGGREAAPVGGCGCDKP